MSSAAAAPQAPQLVALLPPPPSWMRSFAHRAPLPPTPQLDAPPPSPIPAATSPLHEFRTGYDRGRKRAREMDTPLSSARILNAKEKIPMLDAAMDKNNTLHQATGSNRSSILELSSPKSRVPTSPARGTIFSLMSFWNPASPCFSRRVLKRSLPSTYASEIKTDRVNEYRRRR